MKYRVRITQGAGDDLDRLIHYLAIRDVDSAVRASEAILSAFGLLEDFPFSCRKFDPDNPLLRELVIDFGQAGYIALFEIETGGYVSILAIRHQLEDDYL